MEYLIIFFAVVTILLIAALAALIFILCKSTLTLCFGFFIASSFFFLSLSQEHEVANALTLSF